MRICFLLILLMITLLINAQEFGGNPPSLKWKQINTPVVRVIFPAGLDKQAARVADIAGYLNQHTGNSIGTVSRKIDIVLQNQTTISNGYVGLAPWRSEFFLTPMQNSLSLGSLNWIDQLAAHEYRHVQQYMNFRKGLSRVAYFIAGEEGQALANNAAIPNWFFEGDAVFQETKVTEQGRGRLPAFFSEYRAIWEGNRDYSYMKLRNGSLKHLVPDHYTMGYMMVSYGNNRYGEEFWKKVTADAARFKPLFYPMQGAVKRHSGMSFKEFASSALREYRSNDQYKEDDDLVPLTEVSEDFVKDYAYPYIIGQDSMLIYRRTGRHIPGFYLTHHGKEEKLATRDISIDEQFSYNNGKIVYVAYRPDIRWGWRDYSELVIFDIRTGTHHTISSRSKYFSPDISHDSKKLAVVDVQPTGNYAIHILDGNSGKSEKIISDTAFFYTQPRFSQNDKSLFCPVRLKDGRMSILKIDIENDNSQMLLPLSFRAIAFPYVQGDSLYFTANHHGQDQLMLWDDKTKTLHAILRQYTGIMQAVPYNKDSVLFTANSAWGKRLFKAAMHSTPVSMNEWQTYQMNLYGGWLKNQQTLQIDKAPATEYEIKKYRNTSKFFNFHSWRPFYEQPDWTFSIYGNNILNTVSTSLYYLYNENEGYHQVGFNGAYAAWFPWITGGVSYTLDRKLNVDTVNLNWNEFNANIGLRVPLNFTRGKTYKFITLQSLFNTEKLYFNGQPKESDFSFNYLDNSLSWSIRVQQATQHIFPRFANALTVRYRSSITDIEARQLLATTSVYLPGLFRNHSLVINGGYQSRDTAQQYLFSNSFPLSRGYDDFNFPRMWKWGLNYHIPIVYPDWGFAQLVYFMRVRANIFYDQSYLKSLRTGITTPLASTGIELFFDTRWWNQQPVTFGFRYARLLDTDAFANPPNPNRFEFVLPVNLIPR